MLSFFPKIFLKQMVLSTGLCYICCMYTEIGALKPLQAVLTTQYSVHPLLLPVSALCFQSQFLLYRKPQTKGEECGKIIFCLTSHLCSFVNCSFVMFSYCCHVENTVKLIFYFMWACLCITVNGYALSKSQLLQSM